MASGKGILRRSMTKAAFNCRALSVLVDRVICHKRIPLKAQVKHRVTGSPTPHYPLEFEITFCVRGVITAPCGVPAVVSDHLPSSDTPAFSHL